MGTDVWDTLLILLGVSSGSVALVLLLHWVYVEISTDCRSQRDQNDRKNKNNNFDANAKSRRRSRPVQVSDRSASELTTGNGNRRRNRDPSNMEDGSNGRTSIETALEESTVQQDCETPCRRRGGDGGAGDDDDVVLGILSISVVNGPVTDAAMEGSTFVAGRGDDSISSCTMNSGGNCGSCSLASLREASAGAGSTAAANEVAEWRQKAMELAMSIPEHVVVD